MRELREYEEVEDKEALRAQVIDWGYPRWITDNEMIVSSWFSYGPGVFWMSTEEDYPDELLVHCCLPEDERGKPFARDWLTACKTIGQLWGFETLRVWVDWEEDLAGVPARILEYLIRLGFTPDHRGVRCATWGSLDDGESTESSAGTLPTSG